MVELIDPAKVSEALLSFAEEEFDYPSLGEFTNSTGDVTGKYFDVPGLGIVTIVNYQDYDIHKNYDGWTENLWTIFEIKGVLYKATGTHTSWTGSEWSDEVKIVVPKNKTIVEYVESNGYEYLI
jgi:hypothetical protein